MALERLLEVNEAGVVRVQVLEQGPQVPLVPQVPHRHEELHAAQLPALASTCMAVKGLTYKSTWDACAPFAVTLDGGDAWTFDVKKPEEGLILVGGELGPIDASLFIGSENFIRTKLFKKANRIGGYLQALVSIVAAPAKAEELEDVAKKIANRRARDSWTHIMTGANYKLS